MCIWYEHKETFFTNAGAKRQKTFVRILQNMPKPKHDRGRRNETIENLSTQGVHLSFKSKNHVHLQQILKAPIYNLFLVKSSNIHTIRMINI